MRRYGWALGLALALVAGRSLAADTVRVGKAASVAWTFTVLDVGKQEGLFAKYGIDPDITSFAGDAKLQQALAADSLDFALGSGPSMAFTAKGAPNIAIAAFAGAPRNIGILVGADSPVKTAKDLKGKTIAVTTAGSLTEWLAKQMAIQEGLGTDGIKIAALGTFETSFAALETHQVDAMVAAVESGYRLEEEKKGRIVTGMEKYAPHFITHVVFARKALVKDKPDEVRRFLQGFFATIAYMKSHRAETVAIGSKILNLDQSVMDKTYDYEISMFTDDGRFDPEAVKVLKQSWVDLGTLPDKPKDDQVFTTEFVPVKP
jgi:ABC-type nitrate/sulfonate/bicarbonate transport system substrate-binding protein